MGKVRSAKAIARELREKIYTSKHRRKALEKYLETLKINYETGLISYARYVEILHKKTDGRDIHELIEYYKYYEKQCEKLLRKQQTIIAKSSIATAFLILGLFGLIFVTTYYIQPTFTGFVVQENITILENISEELHITEVLPAEETSNLSQQEPLSPENITTKLLISGF